MIFFILHIFNITAVTLKEKDVKWNFLLLSFKAMVILAISFLSWHDNVGDPPLSGILVQQISNNPFD
jgi:hypothetical protein